MSIMYKNKGVQRFCIKLLVFFITVKLIDIAIGYMLKKYYFKQQSGYDYLTTYSIEQTKADILILGSSRAVNILDPTIFERKLNLTCYNAGRYGEPIFYHYAILKTVLKRYQPKIIILTFDAGNFNLSTDAYDRLSALLPYYEAHPEIRSIVELKSPFEKFKMMSAIYPYNSLLLSIINGYTYYSKIKYATIKGHIPLIKTASGPLKNFNYTNEKVLDTIKINTYKSFINECVLAHIQLYIVCPPYHIDAVGTDLSITVAKDIALQQNITFLDYSKDSFYTGKPVIFADFRHLNYKGVEIISKDIIKKISEKL